jgi:sugar lactone lactonase YvrE
MKSLGKILGLAVCVLVAALLLLFFLPSRVDPVAWKPQRKPRPVGGYAENRELLDARRLAEGKLLGPEDLALDGRGSLYAGTADGKVVRVGLMNEAVADFATTGGRPLGLRFDAEGRLIVCDAHKGLLAIDREGRVATLTREAGGRELRFADNLDVAKDGTIYFTDASDKFTQAEYLYDLLEARPHGRLLKHDPRGGETRVLLEGLYFANGVALSTDESYLVVSETYRYRLTRYWLAGEKAGRSELMADNLPGFPDNVSRGPGNTFWVAFFTVRNDTVDALHPRPFAKKLLARLPRFVWPKAARYGFVAQLAGNGRPIRSLHDPTGERLFQVTSAREHDGILYLGTLDNPWLARYTLKQRYVPLPVEGAP